MFRELDTIPFALVVSTTEAMTREALLDTIATVAGIGFPGDPDAAGSILAAIHGAGLAVVPRKASFKIVQAGAPHMGIDLIDANEEEAWAAMVAIADLAAPKGPLMTLPMD